jgi:hypothetical protein
MKEILLMLGKGSLEKGFSNVNVELKGDDFNGWKDTTELLPETRLKSVYESWLILYRSSVRLGRYRGTTFHTPNGTQASLEDIYKTTEDITNALNSWLVRGDFARIEANLRTALQVNDRISLSIITDDEFLWKLPWHLWDFCKDYQHCVESFSKSSIQNRQRQLRANGRVDILAISGNAPELGLTVDLAALQQPRARVIPCKEPNSVLDISNALISQKQIRILFFGGHGKTIELELEGEIKPIGKIYLDRNTSISISKIKEDLRIAVERGLQIAIFNCCSGLGLAWELAELNIPYTIVMRSQIPEWLAQQFCSDLLGTYSKGGDFAAAFHHARGRLVRATDLDDDFDSWLPMLLHNPDSNRSTWADLSRPWWQVPAPQPVIKARRWLTKPDHLPLAWMGISLLSTGITLGLQTFAPVQKIESLAIDRFQAAQVAMNPAKSRVVVIDMNDLDEVVDEGRVVINGESISSEAQLQAFTQIPFLALGLDVDVKIQSQTSDSLLGKPNVSVNCDERPPTMTYSSQIDRNCLSLAWAVTNKHQAINKSFILNPYLIPSIEKIKLADAIKLIKHNSDIFKDKILIIGFVKDRYSPAILHAIAAEQIARSIVVGAAAPTDNHQPLTIPSSDSSGTIYILIWSGLSSIIILNVKKLFPTSVGMTLLSLGTSWLLFASGYLLPLVPAIVVIGISSTLIWLLDLPNDSTKL